MPRVKTTPTTIQDDTNELLRVAHVTFQLDSLSKQLTERNESQAKHEARMETKFDNIEKKLEEIPQKYVSKEYFNERLESMNKDVESINANITRLVWLVMTAVIMALLSMVIMNPFKLGGA
jgi:chromosome segregation ATPase